MHEGRREAHGTAPIRLAPNESAATPDTPTSTGSPAASARSIAGITSGSTLTTLARPRIPRRHPGDQPAAADGDQHRVEPGHLVVELTPHRALAGHDQLVVVGVHEQRAGLRGAGIGGALRVVVDLAARRRAARRSR